MRTPLNWICFLAIASTMTGSVIALAQTPSTGKQQSYPWKVIQIIVPSPPGSPPDARARELAEKVAIVVQPVRGLRGGR